MISIDIEYSYTKNIKKINKKLKLIDEQGIYNKVVNLLCMCPANSDFQIKYVDGKKQIAEEFKTLYKVKKKYIAFYSPKVNTVFISVKHLTTKVLAHEICHVILTKVCGSRIPGKVQEIICQWIERFF